MGRHAMPEVKAHLKNLVMTFLKCKGMHKNYSLVKCSGLTNDLLSNKMFLFLVQGFIG